MRRSVRYMHSRRSHARWYAIRLTRLTAIVVAGALACAFATQPVQGRMQQPPPAGSCQVSGRAIAGTTPLPGVAVLVRVGGAVKGATSTDTDGTYRLLVPPGSYELSAELTGFDPVAKPLAIADAAAPCTQAIDFQLSLAPRVPRAPAGSVAAAPVPASAPVQQGRGAPPSAGAAAQRFATLSVQTQAAAASGIEDAPDNAARLLLPPGFSTEGPTEALAVNGSMASLDRGMLSDRLEAIGRGEFNPVTGEFGEGFGPGGRGGFGGPGAQGRGGGFGGGRGGPGGDGGSRRIRTWRPRPIAERIQPPVELFVRRLRARQCAVSTAPGLRCAAASVFATDVRSHRWRPRAHQGFLQGRPAHEFHCELFSDPRWRSLRSICDGPEPRDAHRRLLGDSGAGDRSRDRSSLCRQPDPGGSDERGLGRRSSVSCRCPTSMETAGTSITSPPTRRRRTASACE